MNAGAGGAPGAPGAPSPVASTSAASRCGGASVEEAVAAAGLSSLAARTFSVRLASVRSGGLLMRHRWRRGRGRLAQEIFRVRAAHAKIAAARLAFRVVVAMAVAIDAPDRILAIGAPRPPQGPPHTGSD